MTTAPRIPVRPLLISTLSPVHIGCGEVYEPSGFVIHQGLLHALDPADLAAALTDSERKRLATLAEQREPIGAMQRFFRDSAPRFAELARHQVEVAPELAREYASKIGRPTQPGQSGDSTYNSFQLARTAYQPLDDAPYLPGSSLKGSIRTAWLNKTLLNSGIDRNDRTGKPSSAGTLEQRLLGYQAGKFENDPFRLLALADASAEDASNPPPSRVLYAISKRKRLPRDDERSLPELKVFLETIPEALPGAFLGEMRFGPDARILWNALCDACNAFYQPQLEAELCHPVLGDLLEKSWYELISGLLGNELGELIRARQGFLLRVGHHSGAEAVTLDGWRSIEIRQPGGQKPFPRSATTTQKRYASLTRAGDSGLLPFGWIWVDACDDGHRHLSDTVRQRLSTRSRPLLEAHRDRLARREEKLSQRTAELARMASEKEAAAAAARAEEEASEQRARELASMSPNCRRVQQFVADFAARAEQLRGGRENANGVYHGKARALARDAAEWPGEERLLAAEALEQWLPKVVRIELKEERKKLKLTALRSA